MRQRSSSLPLSPSPLFTRLFLSASEQENDGDEHGEQREDEEENLPEAVGPLALHLAGAAVDDHLVDLLAVAVRADVDGEQEVLEGDGRVAGLDAVDALLVAADVAPHVRLDDGG